MPASGNQGDWTMNAFNESIRGLRDGLRLASEGPVQKGLQGLLARIEARKPTQEQVNASYELYDAEVALVIATRMILRRCGKLTVEQVPDGSLDDDKAAMTRIRWERTYHSRSIGCDVFLTNDSMVSVLEVEDDVETAQERRARDYENGIS